MANRIIGLDMDEGAALAAGLYLRERDKIGLESYRTSASLKEIAAEDIFKKSSVIIGVPTQAVLFRTFALTPSFLKNKARANDITAFITHQNLPFKLEECFWDTFIINNTLNLMAVKKEVMDRYTAAVEVLGLRCAAAIPSFVALYNVFIYNYPEKQKEKWAILNVKNSASDLLICEDGRLWLYPLSTGRIYLREGTEALEKFVGEIQQVFNNHYLQNPSAAQKRTSSLYLCGQTGSFENLISYLKNALADFEIAALESVRRIGLYDKPSVGNQQLMALSLGLGLTYFKPALCLKVNLIREQVRLKLISQWQTLAKKASLYAGAGALLVLLLVDIGLARSFALKTSLYKKKQFLINTVLPQVKALKQQKEELTRARDYLEGRLAGHGLLLKALAKISQNKPLYVRLEELEAKIGKADILVNLSGKAPEYEEVNIFLSNLKKSKDIKDAKVFSSTFPSGEDKEIAFKLRFESK